MPSALSHATGRSVEASFTALPLQQLADAALQQARDLQVSHADVRIERIRVGDLVVRDAKVESQTDSTDLGISVRVIHGGAWGFAAGVALTAEAARDLADQAVATAKVAALLGGRAVELAPEPVHQGTWVSSYEIDPFAVSDSERQGRWIELSERLLASDGVHHAQARVEYVSECKFYADLAGSQTTQQRIRIHPTLEATHVGQGFSTMRTIAPPVGRGWEYCTGTGWDFDAEIAELPELLTEHTKAPSVVAGPTDLVIDPSNLWLTIHESIGHATELDRALGYESAYAGTSFATWEKLGNLRYGAPIMNVTGDRVTEHGLSSVGWDDEGVAAHEFDLIRDGVLVGYQLNRQMAHDQQLGQSNGCAFADSPGHIPMQRMPNVSLQPAPDGPTTQELISRVEDGIYIVGDKSWSIDMQRYNFQFTGQRFFKINNGQLAGQVRDVAYQATTTDFWGAMEAVGGPETYVLGGAFNCGKGQPGQVAPVSHGCPSALFRKINILNTVAEGDH